MSNYERWKAKDEKINWFVLLLVLSLLAISGLQ